jgi:hypothetical protein
VFHILGLDGIGLVLGSLSLFVVNCIMLDLLSMVVLLLEVLVHGVWWMADYVGSGAKVEWSNRQMRLERTREVMPVPSLWTGDSAGRETIDASYEKQSSARLTPVFDHLYPRSRPPSTPQTVCPWGMEQTWAVGTSLSRSIRHPGELCSLVHARSFVSSPPGLVFVAATKTIAS